MIIDSGDDEEQFNKHLQLQRMEIKLRTQEVSFYIRNVFNSYRNWSKERNKKRKKRKLLEQWMVIRNK